MKEKKAIATATAPLGAAQDIQWTAPAPQPASNNELPPIVSLSDELALNMPPAPVLIEGLLRVAHKMIMSGPAKAGKSFLAIALALAVVSGSTWLGRQCRQGRVLYLNLELDRPSCVGRFRRVMEKYDIAESQTADLDIIHLRGHVTRLDHLAAQIIERANSGNYALIVIDPLYKLLTGDENSAAEMSVFCSYLDQLCTQLGCAIVIVHHHPKGLQGVRSTIDRASGSSVLARDADAIFDISPLDADDDQLMEPVEASARDAINQAADDNGLQRPPEDEKLNDALTAVTAQLDTDAATELAHNVAAIRNQVPPTAWRISAALREFCPIVPQNTWFTYPVHTIDEDGVLDGCAIPGERDKHKLKEKKTKEFEDAFHKASADGTTAKDSDIAKELKCSIKTVQRRAEDHTFFTYSKHVVTYMH